MGHPLELSIIENTYIEEWINQYYSHFSETIAFKGHIMTNKKQHLDPSKKWTSSILIITIYHIIIFSDGKDLSKKLPKEYHIYDCKKLTNKEDYVLSMTFQKGKQKSKIIMKTEQMNYIVSLIRRLRFQLDTDHCSKELRLNVRQFLKQPLDRKEFTNFEGFLDLYKGWCSYFTVEPNQSIIDYIHNIIIQGNKEIDLNELETSEQSELQFDQVPFIYTLKHNSYFNSLILKDLKKDMSLKALGDVLLHNTTIKKLILKKTGSDSLQNILISISTNKRNSIQILDISENILSNKSISSLIFLTTNFNHSLVYLNLANCSIPPKSMACLFDSFEKNYGMSLTLEYLNISGNKLDEQGNTALASWLIKSRSHLCLKNFIISSVGISSQSLYAIRNLTKLEYLDLSFNKIELTDIERLSVILSMPSLYRIDCNYCGLAKELLSLIFSKMSEKKLNVHIELAGLNLGSQEEVNWDMLYTNMALFKETPIKIKTLNLKHVRGTEKTLIALLNVLADMKIDELILDSLQLYNPQYTHGSGNGGNGNGSSNSNGGNGGSGNNGSGNNSAGTISMSSSGSSLNVAGGSGSISNSNSPLNSPFTNNTYSPGGNQKDDDMDDDVQSSYSNQSPMTTMTPSVNNHTNNHTNGHINGASTLSIVSSSSNYSTSSSTSSNSSSIYSTVNSSFISSSGGGNGSGSNISLLSASTSNVSQIGNQLLSASNLNFKNQQNGNGNGNGNNSNQSSPNHQQQNINNDYIVSSNKPFKQLFLKSLGKIYNNPEIRFLGLSEIGKIITSFIPIIGKSGSNNSVLALDISCNGIGDYGASLLSVALASNRSLISINIDGNSITHIGWSGITRSISPIYDSCSYDILLNSAKENQTLPSTISQSCLCSMNFPKLDFERIISNSEDISFRTSIYMSIANMQMALQKNGSILLKSNGSDSNGNGCNDVSKNSNCSSSNETNANTSKIKSNFQLLSYRITVSIPVGYLFKRFMENERSTLIPNTPNILYPITPIPPTISSQINDKLNITSEANGGPNQSALYSIIATLRDPYYRSTPTNSLFTIQYTNNILLPTRNSPIPFILSYPDQSDDDVATTDDTSSNSSQNSFYNQYHQNISKSSIGNNGGNSGSNSNISSTSSSSSNSPISILNRTNSPSIIKKLSTSDFYVNDVINKLDMVVQESQYTCCSQVTSSPIIPNIKHIKNLDLLEKEKDRLKEISNNGTSVNSSGPTTPTSSRSSLITSTKSKGISKSFIEEGTNKVAARKSITINGNNLVTSTASIVSSTSTSSDSLQRQKSSSSVYNPIAIIQNSGK